MGLSRTDLTTIATRTGHKVVAAWSTWDKGPMGSVYGVVLHHTGSAQNSASVAPTLAIVRQGRSDLQNALCTFYIDKAGTIYLVTEKIAWHAGVGSYRGIADGNGHFLGIEAESDGKTWTTQTVDAYVALVAEICRYLGVDVNTWAIRHATWATPPGRKTDFAGLSENDFKARVAARLNGTDDDMPLTDNDLDRIAERIVNRQVSGDRQLWQVLASLDSRDPQTNPVSQAVVDRVVYGDSTPLWQAIQILIEHQEGFGRRTEDTQARVTALQTVVTALAANGDLTADEIEAAVAEALRENIVQVNVAVSSATTPAS